MSKEQLLELLQQNGYTYENEGGVILVLLDDYLEENKKKIRKLIQANGGFAGSFGFKKRQKKEAEKNV